MVNLIEFLRLFLSYLLVFAIFSVVIVIAVFAGISLRKRKNKNEALLKSQSEESKDSTL